MQTQSDFFKLPEQGKKLVFKCRHRVMQIRSEEPIYQELGTANLSRNCLETFLAQDILAATDWRLKG
jgi:hypothetical protein